MHTTILSTQRYAHLGDTALKQAARETDEAARAKVTRRSRWVMHRMHNVVQLPGIVGVGRAGLEPAT